MPKEPIEGTIENLQTRGIYTRSPFFVTINEPLQTAARIQMWIWRADQPIPTTPTYVREKLIPASDKTKLHFNLSNFINEFYEFPEPSYDYNVILDTNPKYEYCYIKYKIYYTTNTVESFVLKETKTYRAFYGWGTFEEGYNPDLGQVHLTQGTYYYHYPNGSAWPTNPAIQQPELERWGSFRFILQDQWKVRYTNLINGATLLYTYTSALGTELVRRIFNVYPTLLATGCKTEVLDASSQVVATFTFLPMEECKYEPVICDFVNKYGAWQRTWFYKVSNLKAKVVQQEYSLMAREVENYDIRIGQRQVFNVNGKDEIEVNTGWVDEEYAGVLQELILAEVIQINGLPAKCTTKELLYQKHINNRMINYKLSFEYAYDTINSII
jgi:hypothetical protein